MPETIEEATQTTQELTPKQRAFVRAYVMSGVGAQAYREAYGANASQVPHKQATKLLGKAHIQEAIEKLRGGDISPVLDQGPFGPATFDHTHTDEVILCQSFALSQNPRLSPVQQNNAFERYFKLRDKIDFEERGDDLSEAMMAAIAECKAEGL